MYKDSDGNYNVGHIDWWIVISLKDKWIGLRPYGGSNKKEELWRNRTGVTQRYQLNLLPCVSIFFDYTKWSKIKEDKRKRK